MSWIASDGITSLDHTFFSKALVREALFREARAFWRFRSSCGSFHDVLCCLFVVGVLLAQKQAFIAHSGPSND